MSVILLSVVLPNSILSIDILLASIFALFGFRKSSGIHFDLFNMIISVVIGWRAATVAIIAGITQKIWTSRQKFMRIIYRILIIICIGTMILMVAQLSNLLFAVLLASGTAFDPTSGRLVMWIYSYAFWYEGLQDFRIQNLLGYGFNYPSHMFSNLDALNTKISILGLDIESSKNTADKSRLHLHNFILQSLIEFGLLGLLFQMWLITKLYAAKGKIAIVTNSWGCSRIVLRRCSICKVVCSCLSTCIF